MYMDWGLHKQSSGILFCFVFNVFSINSEPEKSVVVMWEINIVKKTNTNLEVSIDGILLLTYNLLDDTIGARVMHPWSQGPIGSKTHRRLDPKGTGNISQCLCQPPLRLWIAWS